MLFYIFIPKHPFLDFFLEKNFSESNWWGGGWGIIVFGVLVPAIIGIGFAAFSGFIVEKTICALDIIFLPSSTQSFMAETQVRFEKEKKNI